VKGVAAALAIVLTAAGAAAGAGSQSRVIDRTFLCNVPGVGVPDPARFVTVGAFPRRGGKYGPSVLAFQGSGSPEGWNVDARTEAMLGVAPGIFLNRSGCVATRTRVALSPGRLPGGRTRLGKRWVCDGPAKVLVRLRAVFRRPTSLRPESGLLIARGRMVEVSLVVTDTRHRPISFGSAVDATGVARLFVDRVRCLEAPS
jgi:hypothetical protein